MLTRDTPSFLEPLAEGGGPRLVDAFAEIFAYVGLLLEGLPGRQPACAEVAGQFAQLVERAERYRDACGMPRRDWEAAFFAVCAWADESLACSAWEGRAEWTGVQLQRTRFNTVRAGEQFFERLEDLAPGALEVREVFATCLALGFRGSLYAPEHRDRLAALAAGHLRQLTGGREAALPADPFPEAGAALAPAHRPPTRWRALLAAAAVLLVPVLLFVLLDLGFKAALDESRDRFTAPLAEGARR